MVFSQVLIHVLDFYVKLLSRVTYFNWSFNITLSYDSVKYVLCHNSGLESNSKFSG